MNFIEVDKFLSNSNDQLVFRRLDESDELLLGDFFESLSEETRSRFGPHPLNKDHAHLLCGMLGKDNFSRFIVRDESKIIGYFVIDFNPSSEDSKRYIAYGIELDSMVDPTFAPCIADNYKNKGIASKAMEFILLWAKHNNLKRIVLMGGTQETNSIAISFYKKFGFEKYGEFYTQHNGQNNFDMMLIL